MQSKASVFINIKDKIAPINPNIYGHFAEHLGTCIMDGIWVGIDSKIPNTNGMRIDVIEALKKINVPIIRWPGGCFADDYHWMDGVGPRETRPRTVNTNWDAIETNEFGTNEFMEFCKLIKCEPYIVGNVGSGTVKEMRDWLEYMNYSGDSTLSRLRTKHGHPEPYNIKYFGIGNENWGCGGNMHPRYYAYEYKRYAQYAHSFNNENLYRIACGPPSINFYWTYKFFDCLCENMKIGCPFRLPLLKGFALHYYCGTAGTATEYNEDQWFKLLRQARRMEPLIVWNKKIMNHYDKHRRVDLIVDEWGTWHKTMEGTNPKWLRQHNTIRDALVAAITLDIFNKHANIVAMSNIAQIINVLQAMIMTDGPKMHLTPNFYVYEMYAPHQGGESIKVNIKSASKHRVPLISGSCSIKNDIATISLVNADPKNDIIVQIGLKGWKNSEIIGWKILTAEDIHDYNSFDDPNRVKSEDRKIDNPFNFKLELPQNSVNVVQIKK